MATLAEQLAEARDAYHALQTGKAAVRIRDSNGEDVTYTAANVTQLARYCSQLEAQLTGQGSLRTIIFRTSKGL